jgi:hypothetical protein
VDQLTAAYADGRAALEALRSDLDEAIRHELSSRGIVVPELTGANVAAAVKELLLTDELEAVLEAALASLDQEAARRGEAALVEQQRQAAQADAALAQARQSELRLGPLDLAIDAPDAFTGKVGQGFLNGPVVPVSIRIDGGHPSMLEQGAGRRVLVALNAQPLALGNANVRVDASGALRVSFVLRWPADPLQAGLNVLECSVTDGHNQLVRESVPFVCDPRAAIVEGLSVVPDASVFDTAGNDHRAPELEEVAIHNGSGTDIELEGWRVVDRAHHVFVFGERTLEPGATLRVHTGAGRDATDDVYMGRRAAVWNNEGDVANVVDPAGVLQLRYGYGRFAES